MALLAPRLLGPAATTSTAIRDRPVTTWVRAHPVAAYLGWMLTVGWAFALFPTLAKKTLDIDLPLQPFILASTWLGMLLPALVITGIVDGSKAVRGLLTRALPPRIGIGWYAVALIAVPLTAVGLAALAFGPLGRPRSARRGADSKETTPMFRSLLGVIRRHPLVSFFLLAFGLTWAIMVPQVLGSYGLIPVPEFVPLLIVMGYGPTFAALLVTGAVDGRPAIGALLKRMLIWRVGWGWWTVTLFLNAVVVAGALAAYALLGNELPPHCRSWVRCWWWTSSSHSSSAA
jgi:hypothetical protein